MELDPHLVQATTHVLQDGAYEGGDTRGTPHAEAEAAKAPCKETDLLVPQLTVMCCIAASFVDTCIVWVNCSFIIIVYCITLTCVLLLFLVRVRGTLLNG